jgi:transposase
LIETFQDTGSIRETAARWHTSRLVVRKWLRRFREQGEEGLQDRSRRPHRSPCQTPPEVEQLVLQAREATNYGRERLALYLKRLHDISISPYTIRNILRRNGVTGKKKRSRKPVYPARWAWSEETPFALIQADAKDVLDKKALGTTLWNHIRRRRLPRYQWTACEARSRLRFLAYSHRLNRTNGIAFFILALLWLRAFGITTNVTFQTDWGQEFGGDNLDQIAAIEKRFLAPLNGALRRYPKGRKQYNGRVERSHRTDDEELYRPYLLRANDTTQYLSLAARWIYFYNVQRFHLGAGMDHQPPLVVLRRLGYNDSDRIALLPPILLDPISPELLLSCDPEGGNDVLAHYPFHCCCSMNLSPPNCSVIMSPYGEKSGIIDERTEEVEGGH